MSRGFATARGFGTSRGFRTSGGTGGGGTPPVDGSPQLVSGPTLLARTTTTLQLTWTADQFVQSWLQYGTTAGYGSETTHETSFNYQTHIQTISNLSSSTTYHVRAVLVNQAGLLTYGSDVVFTTDATVPPPTTGINYTDYTIPTSIDQTGATDVYVAMQAFIDSVPSGSNATNRVRVRPPSATSIYRMTEGLQLGNKSYFDLDGRGTGTNGATINAHPTTYDVGGMLGTGGNLITSQILIGLRRSGPNVAQQPFTDVKVYGWQLNGSASASTPAFQGEAAANITVGPGTGYEIYNIRGDKARGDFIDVAGYGAFNGYIHDVTNIRCERNFLTFDYAEDCLVERFVAGISSYYFVDFEVGGGGRQLKRITIRNGTWERWDDKTKAPGIGGFIAGFNQANAPTVEDVLIENITVTGSHHATLQSIIGDNTANRIMRMTVRNCTSAMTQPTSTSGNQLNYVMRVRNTDNFTWTGNTQPGASGRWFGALVNNTGMVTTGNTPPTP